MTFKTCFVCASNNNGSSHAAVDNNEENKRARDPFPAGDEWTRGGCWLKE